MKKNLILTIGVMLTLPLFLTTLSLSFVPMILANAISSILSSKTFSAVFLNLSLTWQATFVVCALIGCLVIIKNAKANEQVCQQVSKEDK